MVGQFIISNNPKFPADLILRAFLKMCAWNLYALKEGADVFCQFSFYFTPKLWDTTLKKAFWSIILQIVQKHLQSIQPYSISLTFISLMKHQHQQCLMVSRDFSYCEMMTILRKWRSIHKINKWDRLMFLEWENFDK